MALSTTAILTPRRLTSPAVRRSAIFDPSKLISALYTPEKIILAKQRTVKGE